MKLDELKRFSNLVLLYNEIGEFSVDEICDIDTIEELFLANDFNAINSIYNQEGFKKADDVMRARFGIDSRSLKVLALELGYINEAREILRRA